MSHEQYRSWKSQYSHHDTRVFTSELPVINERPHLQTMKTIEAQSEVLIQGRHDEADLITKILLLSIQIQRKEHIISELSNAHTEAIDKISHIAHEYRVLEEQNHELIEMNRIFKIEMQEISNKMTEYRNSRAMEVPSEEMQEKVYKLQSKIRKIESQKIQFTEIINRLKVENSQLSFGKVKAQTDQSTLIRSLQSELSHIKTQFQGQQIVNRQQRFLVENFNNQIKKLKEKQNNTIRMYEDKLKSIESRKIVEEEEENYKIKQNMHTQEKIALLSQELHRLREEVQYLRKCIENKDLQIGKRQNEIHNLNNRLGECQNKILTSKVNSQDFIHQIKITEIEIQEKKQQINDLKENLHHQREALIRANTSIGSKEQEIMYKNQQITRLNRAFADMEKIMIYQKESISLKSQSNSCQRCKYLLSDPTGQIISLEDIILQVQQLRSSNHRVENLLNVSTTYSMNFIRGRN